jgi:hypothetical protein
MDSRKLRELLDACRPASGDLELPELEPLRELVKDDPRWADAFDTAQRWEQSMQQLCHDVPIPAGLEERLLARLHQEVPAEPTANATDSTTSQAIAAQRIDDTPSEANVSHRRGRSRRQWWGTALAVATSLLLAYVGSQFWQGKVEGTQLADDAILWSSHQLEAGRWSSQWEKLDRKQHPMSQYVNAKPRGWQSLSVKLDRQGVAYRLMEPAFGQPPVLLVLRTSAVLSTADERPPIRPNVDSGGVYCGVWREGACLYALVVPGDLRLYQDLTRSPWSVAAR